VRETSKPPGKIETEQAGIRWIREWDQPGLIGFRIGRDGEDLIAEWRGLGTLRAARSGRAHAFTPWPNAEGGAGEGIRRTLIEGLLRHLQGKMSLHASAAARGDRAVVFLGDSTAGKSTLAAELCAREGFEMLADDTVFLEELADGFYVLPTESTHSLREDAARLFGYTGGDLLRKAFVSAAAIASRPAKLAACISLAFDDSMTGVAMRPMRGPEIFKVLSGGLFRFDVDDEVMVEDLSRMAALGAAVPFFELRRAPSLDVLRASVRTLCTTLPIGDERKDA
jgi:hypothetical protein